MAESPPEVVRRLYEFFSEGNVEAALGLLAEDFVIEVPPSMSAEPDVYEGHDGARRYFDAYEGLMEDVRFEPLELIDEGDVVIARLRLVGRGVASGIEVEQPAAAVHWVKEGKIARIDPHPDVESAREALRGRAPADC